MKKTQWGPWTFEIEDLTLNHENGYWIDLQSCSRSAEVLDWIYQIHAKKWGNSTVTGLIDAFRDLMHPQQNICPWGWDRQQEIDPRKVICERLEQ